MTVDARLLADLIDRRFAAIASLEGEAQNTRTAARLLAAAIAYFAFIKDTTALSGRLVRLAERWEQAERDQRESEASRVELLRQAARPWIERMDGVNPNTAQLRRFVETGMGMGEPYDVLTCVVGAVPAGTDTEELHQLTTELTRSGHAEARRRGILDLSNPAAGLAMLEIMAQRVQDPSGGIVDFGGVVDKRWPATCLMMARSKVRRSAQLSPDIWSTDISKGLQATNEEAETALSSLHHWLVHDLLTTPIQVDEIHRYRRRVEDFGRLRFDQMLSSLGADPSHRDEAALRDDLCAFLVTRGLDPIPEHRFGSARADITFQSNDASPLRVAVEVKVVRENDDRALISKRLHDGSRKAATYARKLHRADGFLVVFWLKDLAPPQIPDRTTGSERVRVVIIAPRFVPSEARHTEPDFVWDDEAKA